jgi:AraC-like DNA-binding protein
MNPDNIKISRITSAAVLHANTNFYAVCWIKEEVEGIEIDSVLYPNVANAVFFFNPVFDWKIIKKKAHNSSGYVLYLPSRILDHPIFKNLHISEVRLFSTGEIPKINLTPGIEVRVQAILEMLDELLSTNLKHREEAILSLLNTFFVYCDGKCNIRSVISQNNSKSALVYKLKKVIDRQIADYHEVGDYARLLNVSDKYLNECVKEILGVNAKNLIDEQLTMRARHQLKFTDHSIKEISYNLGFSSPEYFSFFFKKHTGSTPTQVRRG